MIFQENPSTGYNWRGVIGIFIYFCPQPSLPPNTWDWWPIGFDDKMVSLMKSGTRFYDAAKNKYATPAAYRDDFLVSGYLPKGMNNSIKKAAAITVHGIGSGKVICFQDNPLFRVYWLTGQKIFNNALFYSKVIDRRTIEAEE